MTRLVDIRYKQIDKRFPLQNSESICRMVTLVYFIWVSLALQIKGLIPFQLPQAFSLLGAFGPVLSAGMITIKQSDKKLQLNYGMIRACFGKILKNGLPDNKKNENHPFLPSAIIVHFRSVQMKKYRGEGSLCQDFSENTVHWYQA